MLLKVRDTESVIVRPSTKVLVTSLHFEVTSGRGTLVGECVCVRVCRL